MPFRIAYADITQLKDDAIVNPTDRYYSGGGGVDELIHSICGDGLRQATDALPELHLGDAKATPGFGLPCRYIIHTSGPMWRESHFLEMSILGSCYRNSVQVAYGLGCRSIAFPLISSRGKGFPKEQAVTAALDAIMECTQEYPDMDIILTIYGSRGHAIPEGLFEELSQYVNRTYRPRPERRPERMMETAKTTARLEERRFKLEEPDLNYTVAEQGPRPRRESVIRDLLDHPTKKNLQRVEVDENFAQMLNRLIEKNDTKTAEILDALDISAAALSKLRNGINNPSKLTVFALAIFFRLSLRETKSMLMKAGYAFNPSSMQDIIISGLIREGIYDRYQIDDLLYALDLQVLPGAVID